MLKKRLADLLARSEGGHNANFEILRDPAAVRLTGGEVCGVLNQCSEYSGNDNTCPLLSNCGTYTEK